MTAASTTASRAWGRLAPLLVFLLALSGTLAVGRTVLGSRPRGADAAALNQVRRERPEVPAADAPALTVTPGELAAQLADGAVTALDVRPRHLYEAGHLPGAARIAVDPACVAQGIDCVRGALGRLGLTGEEPVALYGGAGDLAALGRYFWLLEWAGATNVRVLDGDVADWPGHGALETGARPLPERTFAAGVREEAAADVDWLRNYYGLAGIEVLDLRDEGVWMDHEYAAPPRFAAGHVPYSLPYDFRPWVADGRWPDPQTGWSRLLELGPRHGNFIDLGAELVVYGEGPGDERLGLAYLLLRRLGARARVFAGGWEAWSGAPDCPRVRVVDARQVAERLAAENPGLTTDALAATLVVFDLRDGGDFDHGHVPGAVNLPAQAFYDLFEPALARHWPDVRRDQVPVALYCYGRDCIRSREASHFAARSGFQEIWWLRDGLDGWPAEYPIARKAVAAEES